MSTTTFTVPVKADVAAGNQAIFDKLNSQLGFVPNLYAYFGKNDTALADYLAFQNRKSTLNAKEREVINLVVSQVNECEYCLAAHTALGKMHGFTDGQILDIRRGHAPFSEKLNALAQFVQETTTTRGKASAATVEQLLAAGYTESNLIDIMMVIGDKTVSNYLHSTTKLPIDFPATAAL